MTKAERLRQVHSELEHALSSALGDDLIALYACDGPAQLGSSPLFPKRELWIFIRPNASLLTLRDTFLPIWSQHADILTGGPAVATPDDFRYYSSVFPHEARRVIDHSHLLTGQALLDDFTIPPSRQPLVQLSALADATLRFSSLLGSDHNQGALTRGLEAYAARHGAAESSDILEQLALLFQVLQQQESQFPDLSWHGPHPPTPAPPALPGLLALVGLDDQLVVVMPEVDHRLLSTTNWSEVADLVSDEFSSILLATPFQLRLAAQHTLAADCFLLTFDQVWGSEILADCRPSQASVMSSAALPAVRGLIELLPATFLTTPDDKLGRLVHDVQNMLLNIQLRSEVIARRRGAPVKRPRHQLPGRGTPDAERMQANYEHFRWWAAHLTGSYSELLASSQD